MLKKLLILALIAAPFIGFAQNNPTSIPIPMKNGIVWYQKSYAVKADVKKQDMINTALKWLKDSFPDEPGATTNESSGEINGSGIFKVITSQSGNYYWLKFRIDIIPGDGLYTFKAYNVYEKPVEKGITNEFSKIEYRWRDFRKGKPWSVEDETLFKGIDSNITAIMASLATKMNASPTLKFRTLALYSTNVESDHVDFAKDAMKFYTKLSAEKGFALDTTSDWENLNDANLKNYQLVIWLNEFPHNEAERRSFEKFMANGGAWLGFHVSGYNDKDTHWPWFVDFMGGAVFHNNNWPPLPARMIVDDNKHPVTKDLPSSYTAPINEWYGWKPNPRDNKDIKVLITLDPSNYPLGKKDVIRSGDIPVVWTNTKYKMLYMNMGHGDHNLDLPMQNQMFENAIMWLGSK